MRKTLIGMAAVIFIGGLAAAACSVPPAEEPTSTPVPAEEPTSTPAPALESSDVGSPEVVVHEMPIDLPVGETYEITLDSNPTTGYGWQVEYNDGDLELVEQRYEPDSDLVGAGGKEVFVFRGRTVSNGDVVFTYKRSWEDEVLKTERYTFDVLAGRFDEMSLSEAMAIASESECADAGPLMENASYNKFTGTWWIDLDAEKEFCPSPACVVNVATKEAEINWMCMGVPPPKDDATTWPPAEEPTPAPEGPVYGEQPAPIDVRPPVPEVTHVPPPPTDEVRTPTPPGAATLGYAQFYDPQLGYRFEYPEDWQMQRPEVVDGDDVRSVVMFAEPGTPTTLVVIVASTVLETLEEVKQEIKEAVREGAILEEREIAVGGREGYELAYKPFPAVMMRQAVFLAGGSSYTLACSTSEVLHDELADTFDHIVNSLIIDEIAAHSDG